MVLAANLGTGRRLKDAWISRGWLVAEYSYGPILTWSSLVFMLGIAACGDGGRYAGPCSSRTPSDSERTCRFGYDTSGHLVRVDSKLDGSDEPDASTMSLTRDAAGELTAIDTEAASMSGTLTAHWRFTSDSVTSVRDWDRRLEEEFDALGFQFVGHSFDCKTFPTAIETLERSTSVALDGSSTVVDYTYDAPLGPGDRVQTGTIADQGTVSDKTLSYDADGRLRRIVARQSWPAWESTDDVVVTEIEHDGDRLTRWGPMTYLYDASGNLTMAVEERPDTLNGALLTYYGYDCW